MFSCADVISAFGLLHVANCNNSSCLQALCNPGRALLRKSSQPNYVTLMKFVSKDEFGGILIDNIRILEAELLSFIENNLSQHATHIITTDFKERTVSCVSSLMSSSGATLPSAELQEVMDDFNVDPVTTTSPSPSS